MLDNFNTSVPVFTEFLNLMYSRIRALKSWTKAIIELDHQFDSSLDTTNINCNGYHDKITMAAHSSIEEDTGDTIYDPEYRSDSVITYAKEIDNVIELCYRNKTGCWQISDKGHIATDLESWDDGDIPSTVEVKDVVYGNGVYIAIGQYSTSTAKVYTSSDRRTWVEVLSVASMYFTGIAFDDDHTFIISAYNSSNVGQVYFSQDSGATWTDANVDAQIRKIIHDGSNYYAVALDGSIFKSTDGSVWLYYSTTGFTTYAIAYGEGVYVAVGYSGSTGYLKTSPDLITWTTKISNTGVFSDVHYNGTNFVAVKSETATYPIYTSVDGVTWTGRNASTSYLLVNVNYVNGYWVACGTIISGGEVTTYTGGFLYSTNLTSWAWCATGSGSTSYNEYCVGVYHDGTNYVSLTGYWTTSSVIKYGTTLTGMSSVGATITDGYKITGHGTTIIVIGYEVGNVYKLSSYTTATLKLDTDYEFIHCEYVNGIFFAGGTYSSIYTSSDADTWTPQICSSTYLRNAVNINGIVFILGDGRMFTWNGDGFGNGSSITYSTLYIMDITYDGSIYYIVAYSGTTSYIYSSSDLTTWTLRKTITTLYLENIIYIDGLYIASARYTGYGKVYLSLDGVTWVLKNQTTTYQFYDIVAAMGKILIPATGGKLYSFSLEDDDTFEITGDTTNGTKVVQNVSSVTNLTVGQRVYGTGITEGTTIASIDSGTQFTMSANATATGTGVAILAYTMWTLDEKDTGISTDLNCIYHKEIKESGKGYRNVVMLGGKSGICQTSKKFIPVEV